MKKRDDPSESAAEPEREPAAPSGEAGGAPAAGPVAGPAAGRAGAEPAPAGAAAENARLAGENELLKQRLLEAAADLDNQTKRFARERQVVRDEIVARTAREMIEVLDNLDRVIESIPEADRAGAISAGVEAIRTLFADKLRGLGVVRIEALDRPFDPFEHEALAEEERDDVPAGTVVAEIAAGYRMGSQLVRAARVRVSRARRDGAAR